MSDRKNIVEAHINVSDLNTIKFVFTDLRSKWCIDYFKYYLSKSK